jgi:hypothetical protein
LSVPSGLVRVGLERALLVRGLTADADRELHREDADDPVHQPAGDEADARGPLEAAALDDGFATSPRLRDRVAHAHLRRIRAGVADAARKP